MSLRPNDARAHRPPGTDRLARVLRAGQRFVEQAQVTGEGWHPMTASEPTGTIGKAKAKSDRITLYAALAGSITEKKIDEWTPPEPLPALVFDGASLPVYIAVKMGPKHVFEGTMNMYKILPVGDPEFKGGEMILNFKELNDESVAEHINKKAIKSDERAFYFQPTFSPIEDEDDPNPNMTNVKVAWIKFTKEEIATVCKNVDVEWEKEKRVYPGTPHIILVIVAEDSHHEDLSAHIIPPEPFRKTGVSNMMVMQRDVFGGESPGIFIAKRYEF